MNLPLLHVDDLHVRFGSPSSPVDAVRGIGFSVDAGSATGIVGESGSGKSTTARAIAGLVQPWRGEVRFRGRAVRHRPGPDGIQMIFQDPIASLNRSEEHTSELQSRENLVCRLLLEKKKKKQTEKRNESRT